MFYSNGRKENGGRRKEKRGGRREKGTPCPPPHFSAGKCEFGLNLKLIQYI